MVALPSCLGVSATFVTTVRRKLGVPPENSKLICSDCERLTMSKSLKSGSSTFETGALEATVTVILRFTLPSRATSSASVEAETWMSSAARAAVAQRAARSTRLPILLDIALPLPLLPGESPDLQVLLARLQRVEEALRLAPVEGFVGLLSGPPRLSVLRRFPIRLLLGGRALLLALVPLRVLILLLSVLRRLRFLVLLLFSGLRRLVVLRLTALLLRLPVVLALLFLLLLLVGTAHGLLLLFVALLLFQEKLEVDLRVAVGRVEGKGLRVGVHCLLGLARLLECITKVVRGKRLHRGVPLLQRLRRIGERARCGVGIAAPQKCRGAVERECRVRGAVLRDLRAFISLDRAVDVAGGGERVAGDDARLRLLPQAAHGATRLRPEAGRDEERASDRPHEAPRRKRNAPSPSIAAAQSRKNAGQATCADRSAYCTESRDSISPFCSFSSAGTSCRMPRSPPDPSRSVPPAVVAISCSIEASARVSTVLPCESFL